VLGLLGRASLPDGVRVLDGRRSHTVMGPMHGPAPHPSATFQRVVISAVSARVCAQLRGDSTGQAQSARIAVACGHVRPGTIGRRASSEDAACLRPDRALLRGGGVCVP
jgi:hypothetical protein